MYQRSKLFVGIFAVVSTIAEGGWRVGSGGDGLAVGFEKAKQNASRIALKIRPGSFDLSEDPALVDWILRHRSAMASDILASKHQWTFEEQPTCAWTRLPAVGESIPHAAPIDFSYPTCRKMVADLSSAVEILIHESVHHFGILEESFANRVALAMVKAWRHGRIDWSPIQEDSALDPVRLAASVWTGQELLVFGGQTEDGHASNQGYLFHPEEMTWRPLSIVGAPAVFGHQAVWIDGHLIVWGGYQKVGQRLRWINQGAIWDSQRDIWQPLTMPSSPPYLESYLEERKLQTLTVVGDSLLILGGIANGDPVAAIFTPATGAWQRLTGAPPLRGGHTAVATDEGVIVWGGMDGQGDRRQRGEYLNWQDKNWLPISSLQAPTAREGHTAVFTGHVMIVFGGRESRPQMKGTGGIYHPKSDSWTPFATEIAWARTGHTAVWTGSEMLIWGGKSNRWRTMLGSLIGFDPVTGVWRSIASSATPRARTHHASVWTGQAMALWGGETDRGVRLGDGGMFFP